MVDSSIVNCGVCDHEFDNDQRPPMLLTCGHTFCLICIKQFERFNGAILCPNCRGADYRQVSQLKKNIQLVPLIEKERRTPELPCPNHPGVESALFCLDCRQSFCAKCVSLHKRHELFSATDPEITSNTQERVEAVKERLDSEVVKAKEAVKVCESLQDVIERHKGEVKKQVESALEPAVLLIRQKQEEIATAYCRKFGGVVSKLKSVTESAHDILRKRQKVSEAAQELNSKLQRTAGNERLKYVAQMETLSSDTNLVDLSELSSEVKNIAVEKVGVNIKDVMVAISEIPVPQYDFLEEVVVDEQRSQEAEMPSSSSEQRQLATMLTQNYDLSRRICEILATTDRKEFMPAESTPYEDRPQKIGFNTTISAPHMHAMTLKMLEERLKPGIKVLDVGCGSGYLTVCLGKMIQRGTVLGVDHIEELINQACDNVLKSHFGVFTSKEVDLRFVVGDGREGLPAEAPFDVIHIGASTPEVPAKLLEQLAPGGRMMLPLGPQNSFQQIVIIDKSLDGQLTRKAHLNVNYAPLIDRQRQCP